MEGLLREIRRLNGWGDMRIAEPFAGGAGASLELLFDEDVPGVGINDADPAIFAFWDSLLKWPEEFQEKIRSTRASIPEWRRQKDIQRRGRRASRFALGFSTFYLNRCNRSGIILNGGPIGGHDQQGNWKIDARYNAIQLSARCARIAEYADRISVTQEDGLAFLQKRQAAETFFFIDPPYYEKGPTLYLNSLDHAYHEELAQLLKGMENHAWVMTYDDCPQIRALYESWATVRPFRLNYSASERRRGQELFICPKDVQLPAGQSSEAIAW
jgi:DNA adenine methylase